ncbi:unnamed protein product [Urochloa humidicola]
MEKAWQATRTLPVQKLENNRFIIEFESEHMHNFVLNGGPWRHKGDALIVVPYDGLKRPSEVVIDAVNVWVRFYDVPTKLRKAAFSMVLARKVSPRVLDGGGPVIDKNFLRARVALPLEEPLKPTVEANVKDSGLMSFEVGYENVPFFCFICGRMGHSKRECPEEEEDSDEEESEGGNGGAKKKKLGEWMRKSPLKRAANRPPKSPAAHLSVNRALNFSGNQLAKIKAASSATNNNGGKRRWLGDERTQVLQLENGENRSPLKLPWGVSNALSNNVKSMAVQEQENSTGKQDARACVSGLNSYAGSSEPSLSVEDLMKGRAKEIPVQGIQERIRAAKNAKVGAEKKGPSLIKEIVKPARKGAPKKLAADGRVADEEQEVERELRGTAVPMGQQGLASVETVVTDKHEMMIHNNKIFEEKRGDLTGAHGEPRQGP